MVNFDKQLEQILIHRKPEFWLNDMFSNLTEIIHDDYSEWLFFKKENDLLFEYDSETESFFYQYSKIYLILKDKYHCNDIKINNLIKCAVEEHLKLRCKNNK